MRVLLLENSTHPAHDVATMLKNAVTLVERVTTEDEANFVIKNYDYDAIIIDIVGRNHIPRLQRSKKRIPVIIVADKSQRTTAIRLLFLHADHCLFRPLVESELLAHISAVVRRYKGVIREVMEFGACSINLKNRTVSMDGFPVQLTPNEFTILEILALRKNSVVNSDTILSRLYPNDCNYDITVITLFISRIRSKLGKVGLRDLISTVRGHGYIIRDSSVDAWTVIESASRSGQDSVLV